MLTFTTPSTKSEQNQSEEKNVLLSVRENLQKFFRNI